MLAVIGAAVASLLAVSALWLHTDRAKQFKAGQQETQGRWEQQTTERLAAAVEDARLSAAETLRRITKQQENQHAQDKLLDQSRRDAAASSAAVERLQLRTSTYLAAAGCASATGDSAIECIRQAAAHVGVALGQCAAQHQQLAAIADDSRARGLKCEADYDSLNDAIVAP